VKLTAAASYFDRLPVYDAYSNRKLFEAQFDLFDDSKRDAVNIMRRTLSVPPMTVLPARQAIRAAEQYWLIGKHPNSDSFMAGLIRTKYTLQMAYGLAKMRTPGQVIANAGGTTAYAGLAWMKDWKEIEYSSQVYPYYEIYFAAYETISSGLYVELEDKVFRTRSTHVSEAGFNVAEADDLQGTRVTVTYSGPGTYTPSTDTISGSSSAIPALKVRYAALYEYEQESAQKHQAGDVVLLVRTADKTSPAVGDEVTLSGRIYRVTTIEADSDCWRLSLRP
jgi:hypothetical protein